VAQAIAQVRPFGLDLCSSVRRDGRLHEGLLRGFFAAVREGDVALRR
jgi:phosphoribosylanthranilate isomerase